MTLLSSERVQRQVARLLGELEEAVVSRQWEAVRDTSRDVLALEPDNVDAQAFLAAAKRALGEDGADRSAGRDPRPSVSVDLTAVSEVVINGRYALGKMIGEGARKRVYEARDSLLDRDVAIAVVKIESLDPIARQRITLEAQAMGRLGSHPHIVTVFDFGEFVPEGANEPHPYLVTELMRRGDVAGLIENAPNNRPAPDDVVRVIVQVCRGLDFAHANGIVHRDVKPGNIWLTKDGTAKIGDFGLAKSQAHDASLTRAGNIVGTVTYMSPEQIAAGEVTARSDLYGLGVVLYEMVCGRPPFMGYDTPSVVRQHLETEPVSPTWHNPQCPKPLEALILRMLAKDPVRRPRSAAEVIKALDGIQAGGAQSRVNGASSGGANNANASAESLDIEVGGVFVGRDEPMDVLRVGLEEAMSGRGRFLMIEGERGIGKTRIAYELAVYAAQRGAETLWGRADEAGATTAYWPWVQAIRSHVRNTEAKRLERELGDGASEIAVVVADVRQKLVGLEPPPDMEDPQQPSFRLYDAVTGFLKAASEECPLVIVLDDLQRADDSTLSLLRFIVPELYTMRVLMIGTMQPTSTLPKSHPLSEIIAYFKRRRLLQRVLLSNLSMDDVEAIIKDNYDVSLSPVLVNGIYSQTKGNPLALSEVADTLLSQMSPQSTKG